MRAIPGTLLAVLTLAGCVSGTRTIVVREYPAPAPASAPASAPSPRPTPAPLPVPRRAEQLEVAVGAPSSGRVPVQTNRLAYVALFEIIPHQGVTLVHPSTPRQGRAAMSGLSWVPVWWSPSSKSPRRQASNGSAPATRPVRYIYALASDTPLQIPEGAFEPGYLEQVLGPAAYRAASPQAAVRALSRRFAPRISDEQWAEDLFAIAPENDNRPPRVARVYCGRRVHELPEDVASRAWCPAPATPPGQDRADSARGKPRVMPVPVRPDSVIGHNGRRIGPPTSPPGRTADLPDTQRDPQRSGTPSRSTPPDTPGRDRDDSEKPGNDRDTERNEKEQADRSAKDKAEKDKAEKDKTDKAAREKAENEKAEKEKADKAAKDKAEKEKADKAAKDKAEKDKSRKPASKADSTGKSGSQGKPDRTGNSP